MFVVWLEFLVATAVIGAAGDRLSRYGDAIAERTGLGLTFMGVIMVATVTSLPELVSGISTVAVMNVPSIGIGNLLGSNLLDMVLIAIDDVAYTSGPIVAATSKAHAGTAISVMFMTGAVIASLYYRAADRMCRIFGWTGLFLVVIHAMNSCILFLAGQ